jgi:hypothetical protein
MRKKTKQAPVYHGICSVQGCREPAEYKAPRSRHATGEYQYLCLNHIREFNLAWDYFDGWSRKQIEDFMDSAAHGHRPTWNMSSRIAGMPPIFTSEYLRDSFFDMLRERSQKKVASIPRKVREAFAILDLETDAPINVIKSQYKKLVKKHHPDVNNGTKASEEAFKRITTAYTTLMKSFGKNDKK